MNTEHDGTGAYDPKPHTLSQVTGEAFLFSAQECAVLVIAVGLYMVLESVLAWFVQLQPAVNNNWVIPVAKTVGKIVLLLFVLQHAAANVIRWVAGLCLCFKYWRRKVLENPAEYHVPAGGGVGAILPGQERTVLGARIAAGDRASLPAAAGVEHSGSPEKP